MVTYPWVKSRVFAGSRRQTALVPSGNSLQKRHTLFEIPGCRLKSRGSLADKALCLLMGHWRDIGAGKGIWTPDPRLGKAMLYHWAIPALGFGMSFDSSIASERCQASLGSQVALHEYYDARDSDREYHSPDRWPHRWIPWSPLSAIHMYLCYFLIKALGCSGNIGI